VRVRVRVRVRELSCSSATVQLRMRLGCGSAVARLVQVAWLIPGLGSTATRLRRSCSSARLFVVRLRLSSAAHEAWLRFGYGRSVAPHARLQRARASANERPGAPAAFQGHLSAVIQKRFK